MTLDEYQAVAAETLGAQCDAVYLAAKLTIEAAEAAQPVIKAHYHAKPLDLAALADELGDVLWYAAVLARMLGLSLSEIAAGNLLKLSLRHGKQYNAAHYTGGQ